MRDKHESGRVASQIIPNHCCGIKSAIRKSQLFPLEENPVEEEVANKYSIQVVYQ